MSHLCSKNHWSSKKLLRAKPGSKHNKTGRVAVTRDPWRESNLDGFQTLLVSDRAAWSLPGALIHEASSKSKDQTTPVHLVLDDRKLYLNKIWKPSELFFRWLFIVRNVHSMWQLKRHHLCIWNPKGEKLLIWNLMHIQTLGRAASLLKMFQDVLICARTQGEGSCVFSFLTCAFGNWWSPPQPTQLWCVCWNWCLIRKWS